MRSDNGNRKHHAALHIRIDQALEAQAAQALAAMGLKPSDAVRLLFHRIVADRAFPLELKAPNQVTRDSMADADDIIANKDARLAAAGA